MNRAEVILRVTIVWLRILLKGRDWMIEIRRNSLRIIEGNPLFIRVKENFPREDTGFKLECRPYAEGDRRWCSLKRRLGRDTAKQRDYIEFSVVETCDDVHAYQKLSFWLDGGCQQMDHTIKRG